MALTKYPEGSLRELWIIAFPLMLNALSMVVMIFADRLFLAHFSAEAHNAAVGATTLGWAFIFGWISLAGISEVFVAQYNGAGMKSRLGEPVWQMIWVSLASIAFFVPLSIWGTRWIFGVGSDAILEREYFQIMVIFGPFYALQAALIGFFIGQGKTRIISWIIIGANIINIALDALLIFGVDGLCEPMGVAGAAIATSMATVFQCFVLLLLFLSRSNRAHHGTGCWRVRWDLLVESVKVGAPMAVFAVFEFSGYGIYYAMMKGQGADYITITGVCQSILILFMFFPEGMNKGTATVVGNLIGARRSHLISKVMVSGYKLNAIFLVALLLSFSFGFPLILEWFLPHANSAFVEEISATLRVGLMITAAYVFFESLRLQFAGVLTAAGDTVFLFLAGVGCVWVLMLLPVYVGVVVYGASVEFALMMWIVYSFFACLLYYFRIGTGKWQTLSITSEIPQ